MTLNLRGIGLGVGMFFILVIAVVTIGSWRISQRAGFAQGGSVDLVSMVTHMFRDPMWWVVFVVMATLGSLIVNLSHRLK
jgi:hypothetical protein